MSPGCATHDEIVAHFLTMLGRRDGFITRCNWGTAYDNSPWEVGDTGTYINGVLLTIDMDYEMGWLLEVVDGGEPSLVNFVVIVTTPYGRGHDSMMYEPDCGTFFERTEAADYSVVSHWAVTKIYGLLESIHDADRRDRELRSRVSE